MANRHRDSSDGNGWEDRSLGENVRKARPGKSSAKEDGKKNRT